MATEISDLNKIQDEDTLRRMWQDTDDFSRKKEIRLHMYKLREERLKSYYITRETVTDSAVTSKPASSSHAESFSDQSFLTMKAKEIRDSASPTLGIKQSNISSSSTRSQSEQLGNQNIVTTSRQTVEKKSFDSSQSSSDQCNKGQTSSTITVYGTSTMPYNGDNSAIISYDSQDLHNNHDSSIRSVQSSATEKYSTSSRREAVSSSAITENKQQKVISNTYNTTQNMNNYDTVPDSKNYKVEYINQKTNEQNIGHLANNASHNSQEAIEYYDTNVSNSRIPHIGSKISTSEHNNQEYNFSRSVQAPSMIKEKVSIENTVSGNNYETKKSANKLSETKCITNKTVSENQQNFDRNIMNELQKLDSYLSTEAVTSPSSPATSYVNEMQIIDRNINSKTSRQIEPTSSTIQEPTDHTTTYQQSYSKISVDTSATHNAFASSLRASPDRSIISPGKRTPSKSSLDRSTPDKSPRTSPEKSSCSDLSRKFTASFQNRVSRNATHMRDSKSSSPTNYIKPKRKQRSSSSSSESDSDDSRATYDTKIIDSTSSRSTNVNNRNIKTENTHFLKTTNENRVQQNRYMSPTKSSGHTSEGSVEREVGKLVMKSPDSSPERSAFKPITLNSHNKSTTVEKREQTLHKKQSSLQKKSSPDIHPVEFTYRQSSLSPNGKKQSSPRVTSPNYQHITTDSINQQKTRKQSPSKLSSTAYVSSVETKQNNIVETQRQPSQTSFSPQTDERQSSKRQSSPQIMSSNICSVENSTNRSQTEVKRQSSPQINISTENIYKSEQRRHPSLRTVTSSNYTNENETQYREELENPVGIEPVKPSRPTSQHKTNDTVDKKVTNTVHHKETQFKKQGYTTSPTHNEPITDDDLLNSNKQPSSIASVTSTCIARSSKDIKNTDKQKQVSSPYIAEPVDDYNELVLNSHGPTKPKRQSPKQVVLTAVSTVSSNFTDETKKNTQKQTSSDGSKSIPAAKEPMSKKATAEIEKISEIEQASCLTQNVLKKKSSPEKILKPNADIQSTEIVVTSIGKSSQDLHQKNKNKKTKNSSIIDGRTVDVDEDDVVEEIKVKITPTNAELRLENSKSKIIHTNSETNDTVKVSVPKQRSASYNEFSTLRKKKSIQTNITTNESTDESSSSSESSSEDEREEVIIEEIFDEFGTPIPRETNPLEAALKLEAAIKSKEEVDHEQQITEDISLIPEEKVNLRTKNQSEEFIRQEKLIQEGDEDDCLPPVEQVLGKDVDKAALNDFLEWERKQSLHKHTHSVNSKENAPKKFTAAEKNTNKSEIKKKVIEPVQSTVNKESRVTNKQLKLRSNDKVELAGTNKLHSDQKIVTKTTSSKKLINENILTTPNLKSPAKKSKEPVFSPSSKQVTKQSSTKDLAQIRKSANVTTKITKQLSDRSLKEKNDKLLTRKLDHQHKTQSETIIKPTKPSNVYQRRVTDQVKSNTSYKSDTNNCFDKENQDILRSSKTVTKESPQKNYKNIKDVTVTKNYIVKPADKEISKKTVPSKTNSSTSHKILQTNASFQTNRNSKDKVIATRDSLTKSTRGKPKSSSQLLVTKKAEKLESKKLKECTISESSSSTSSAENSDDECTTNITSKSEVRHHEFTESVDERVPKKNKQEEKLATRCIEPKDNHLNVVVRMPSSSRETTPNKQTDDRFYPVTDDYEGVPRYADRVTSPETEVIIKRKSTNSSTFEKITDLDEEDELSDADLANASVAERRTKFLESAKETATTKQITIVEDDLFQNRELDVSKTKEMFETIAKNQVPGSNSPTIKPPPIISRPSVFEAGVTGVEVSHDGAHRVISRKLTEQDYQDYVDECEDANRIDITKITKSFEEKAAENSKQAVNVKSKKTDTKISPLEKPESNPKSVSKETAKVKSHTSKKSFTSVSSEDNTKCGADFCTTLSHIKSINPEQSSSPSSGCTSPILDSKDSFKRFSSPPAVSRTQPQPKNHARSPTSSPIREIDNSNKSVKDVSKQSLSSSRDYSKKQQFDQNKVIKTQDHSSSACYNPPISPEIKHTTNTISKSNSKGDIIQSTTHRYEINRKSSSNNAVVQKPIEITQVEIRPSRQVYEHTAITNVRNVGSKFTPVEETFNQKLTRYTDNSVSSSLTKPTESSKRRASKSPSPEKAPLELSFTPKKSRSPPKEVTSKSISSSATNSSTVTTLKRQKSPSPEKVTSKLRNKFTTSTDTVQTKKKKFEKRLSTTGNDYHNRKQFFETNTAYNSPKQKHPAITSKYEITVHSTTKNAGNNHSKTEKSPTRRSLSKSPERIHKPKIETTRKVTEKTSSTSSKTERISPTKTIITTTTTTTTIEPKRFTSSSERVRSSDIKRTSPEKITKKEPFGITLRKTKTPSSTISTTSVKQIQQTETGHLIEEMFANGMKIEEIFNLELLERMLETAVQYDLRSRIRAQIRLVKRQQETIKTSRTPSPEKSSPTRKTKISTTTQHTPHSTSSTSRTEIDGRLSASSNVDRRDKVKKRLFTDETKTSESRSSFTSSSTLSNHDRRQRTGSPVKITDANDLNQSTYQTDFGSALTANNKCKSTTTTTTTTTTNSIISGYGLGPTDENGRPLFGLKALRSSSEPKIADEDLDKCAKIKTNYEREITDNSGRPLFGLKALQKSSKLTEDHVETSSNERHPSTKYDDHRTVKTESSSHVYSSRTAMRSDGSGNVSVYRDEVKGDLFSKDGKEPTGKMISTRYTYHKPDGEEATVKTETTSSYLDGKSRSSEAHQIDDGRRSSSKLGSSSLIRKISNEHFEKAQRKFSSGDEAATTTRYDSDRKSSVDSTSNYESGSSSRQRSTFSKTEGCEKVSTQRYSTESSSSTKHESYDSHSSTDAAGEFGKLQSVSSTAYERRTGDEQPRVSRNDSFRDVKSKFQQATVSSSMKNVSKSPDGRTSPAKLQASRRSPDIETAGTQSSFSSHKSKSNAQSSDGSYYCETRSYTESSSSNSQDLVNRAKDSSSRPRSEYTDEEQEAVSLLNKLVGKSVSLREMQPVPKTTASIESATSKAATLVQKFEKQNKTKQNKEEINVEQIWDEDQLRDLLEACTDYESRRQIRARLRAIMAENKDSSATTTVTTSRSDSFSTVTKVQTKTSSSGRMVKANSVTSPFSKFRQLERQNSLPSSGAPTTKIANPNLTRSATSIKDRLLNWVKAQTKEYENVQIDNFSTSWNNGLAFCALIHHFCPHAFDYNKLTPDQRRHNFELAFRVAEEEAGIVPLLDVEDMVAMLRPDWKCVFCYVQSVYQRFQATSAAVRP